MPSSARAKSRSSCMSRSANGRARAREVVEERERLGGRGRHLGGERDLGVGA
jgi:hypothetical protein